MNPNDFGDVHSYTFILTQKHIVKYPQPSDRYWKCSHCWTFQYDVYRKLTNNLNKMWSFMFYVSYFELHGVLLVWYTVTHQETVRAKHDPLLDLLSSALWPSTIWSGRYVLVHSPMTHTGLNINIQAGCSNAKVTLCHSQAPHSQWSNTQDMRCGLVEGFMVPRGQTKKSTVVVWKRWVNVRTCD